MTEIHSNDTGAIGQIKRQNKKRLLWAILLIAINVLLYTIVTNEQTLPERIKTAAFGFLIGYPILGFIMGTLVALLPYKKMSYANKYVRASLLTIVAIQALMTFALIYLLLMKLVGWY